MTYFYLTCAVLGGTVFTVQFVMALVGFGMDSVDVDVDLPDDLPDDLPHDFSHGHSVVGHGSTWLFGVLSFRTIVAALTFFGLAGMTASQGGQPHYATLLIALVSGGAAMYGVHWMMQFLYKLGQDGTVHIERSVGHRGTVYVPIPAKNAGAGKIQLKLQNRIVEYQAVTAEPEKLSTGANVVVVGIVSPTTVAVELIRATVPVAET